MTTCKVEGTWAACDFDFDPAGVFFSMQCDENRMIHVSGGCTRLLGLPPEHFQQSDAWKQLVHPADLVSVYAHLATFGRCEARGTPSASSGRTGRCAGWSPACTR